jgi:SPP1 gp7 family putative phage head morphogenesis protein
LSIATQPLKPAYFIDIEKQLKEIFYAILFKPLLVVIEKANAQPAQIFNSTESDLTDALQSGRVQYAGGVFSGEFNAAISKALKRMGATFDARSKVFRIDPSSVPGWVTSEATAYSMKAKGAHEELLRVLNETESHLTELVDSYQVNAESSINAIDAGFRHAAQEIIVAPKLTQEGKERLAKEYNQNMKLWIQKFSSEEIGALRQRVEYNATQGFRFDRLTSSIQNRYSVSENKAKFLARQETGLFLAKFRESRFKDAGIRRYRWSTAHDNNVRHDHSELNGMVFSYDNPPVTDRTTGARNNPGADYNCFPADASVEIACGIEKSFRRWFAGELAFVVLGSGKTLRATPNHPVLTLNGWKTIGMLDHSDQVVELSDDLIKAIELDLNERIPTIGKIFESLGESFFCQSFQGKMAQFHGDGTDRNVDVIDTARPLGINGQSNVQKFLTQFTFAASNDFASRKSGLLEHLVSLRWSDSSGPSVRGLGKFATILESHSRHSDAVGLGARTYGNMIFDQSKSNDIPTNSKAKSNRKLTLSSNVGIADRFDVNFDSIFKIGSILQTGRESFSGHVYNLQTRNGWYASANVIVHNCRCVDIPVFEGQAR